MHALNNLGRKYHVMGCTPERGRCQSLYSLVCGSAHAGCRRAWYVHCAVPDLWWEAGVVEFNGWMEQSKHILLFSEYLKHYIVVLRVWSTTVYCCFQSTWSTIVYCFQHTWSPIVVFRVPEALLFIVFSVPEALYCCFQSTWSTILLFSEYLKHYIVVLRVPEALYTCFKSTWSTILLF